MGFFSDFFKNLFAPVNEAIDGFKDKLEKKDLAGSFNDLGNIVKGAAIVAEQSAEIVKATGVIVTGPQKKEIVLGQVSDVAIKPIMEEAQKETNVTKRIFLNILAGIIAIAVPALIDASVASLNKHGWKI